MGDASGRRWASRATLAATPTARLARRPRRPGQGGARAAPQHGQGGSAAGGGPKRPDDLLRRSAAPGFLSATQMTMEVRQRIRHAFEAHKAAGNKAYQAGQFNEALGHYANAIQCDPHNTTQARHIMHSNISAVHASKSDWRSSFQHAYEAVNLRQTYAKGHSRMAAALLGMDMLHEARQSFQNALRLEPDNAQAKQHLAILDAKLAGGRRHRRRRWRTAAGGGGGGAAAAAPAAAAAAAAAVSGGGAAAACATVIAASCTACARSRRPSSTSLPRRAAAGAPQAAMPGAAKRPLAADVAGSEGGGKRQEVAPGQAAPSTAAPPAAATPAPPDSVEAITRQRTALQQAGNAAFREKRHEDALNHFTEAVAICGDAVPREGRAPQPIGRAARAESSRRRRPCRRRPRRRDEGRTGPRGHSRRGNALHAMCKLGHARWEEAEAAYRRAVELDPDNMTIQRALEACVARG